MQEQYLQEQIRYFEFDERVSVHNFRDIAINVDYEIEIFDFFNGREPGYDYDEGEYEYHKTIDKSRIQSDEELEYYRHLWVEKNTYNKVVALKKEFRSPLKIGTLCLILLKLRYTNSYLQYHEDITNVIDERFEFLKFYQIVLDIAYEKEVATSIKVYHGEREIQKFEFPKYICTQVVRAFGTLPKQESLFYYAEYRLYKDQIKTNYFDKDIFLSLRRSSRKSAIINLDNILSTQISEPSKRYFFIDQLLGCIDYMGHERYYKVQPDYSTVRKNAIRKIRSLIEYHKFGQ